MLKGEDNKYRENKREKTRNVRKVIENKNEQGPTV